MFKMTEEIEELKTKVGKYESGNDRLQELQLEMQEMAEQYEQNKKDLYEQLD